MFEKPSHLKTLIRADSSATIGHGHIRRDLVLASHFKDISFACVRLNGDIFDEINYPKFELESSNIKYLINLINEQKFKLLIIDHYGINAKDEKQIKEQTGVKILSFDDEYKEHFCDILLNVNTFADPQKYEALVPKECEICCGENFMLVRDEFYKEREIKREKKFDFFIAFGGSDVMDLSFKTAQILLSKGHKIAVITTSANPNLNALKELAKKNSNLSLFINSKQIARLMNESHELIISASSFANEALVLGAKFSAVKVAQNQDEIYKWLVKKGFKAFSGEEICKKLA
ncbi:UDP-2,4-diacetamido-2,4,6-trideoxy-beta-L-altropyranose hydrolase [Campylobacter californiensis]|uniref:UDP-2,4-diacetamido-2,4, 6-trideoxy-beta-L-altropyranose hydrolase n=1 Tax=Campylobacter californiensis TaxID=1032243 RepID=UPI0014733CF1|nr:UDP-2,4-diacetamido-2,4,6-trideoxy-beta-L-altropyranose hydrolase [Campylobacter sp. RM12916]MBE3609688.1 UDP-2,4-diacetamido-2,4,6-trideoxy-beta-L-altropyranose hydrolase [Campylobacter sp. RM12916]